MISALMNLTTPAVIWSEVMSSFMHYFWFWSMKIFNEVNISVYLT